MVTNTPYEIGGNVLNTGYLITNLPEDAKIISIRPLCRIPIQEASWILIRL